MAFNVGGNDDRCPPGHSRMLYRALKEYVNVSTELVVYPGEGQTAGNGNGGGGEPALIAPTAATFASTAFSPARVSTIDSKILVRRRMAQPRRSHRESDCPATSRLSA